MTSVLVFTPTLRTILTPGKCNSRATGEVEMQRKAFLQFTFTKNTLVLLVSSTFDATRESSAETDGENKQTNL